jgi:tetratricopeptide (TPR) repeat protein
MGKDGDWAFLNSSYANEGCYLLATRDQCRILRSGPMPMKILRAAILWYGLLGLSGIACAQDLIVRISDQDTGSALEQARVEIVIFPDTIAQMAFTNSAGSVEFRRVEQNLFLLRATKNGYQPYEESVDRSRLSMETPTIWVRMKRMPANDEPPGGVISARLLAIPEAARREFKTGLDLMGSKNDPRGSLSHFQKAIDAFPNYYEAYYMLGMAHLKTGNASDGESSLRRAIEINPGFFDPYYPLSELLILRRNYEEAERLLLKPLREDPESWQWPYELGMCYGKMGQWEKGIAMGKLALERKNASPKVRLLLADLYNNAGEVSKAILELEAYLKENPESPMAPRAKEVLKQLRK